MPSTIVVFHAVGLSTLVFRKAIEIWSKNYNNKSVVSLFEKALAIILDKAC